MRTGMFILLGVLLTVNLLLARPANGQNAEEKKVTISLINLPIFEALERIEAKTGVTIMFESSREIFKDSISISATNMKLGDLLNSIFKDKKVKRTTRENVILIQDPSESTATVGAGLKSAPTIFPHVIDAPPVIGIVRDANGNPISGVNIIVKGTKKGTVSDGTGGFSIEVGVNAVLIISSVGYATKEMKVETPNLPLIVSLERISFQLDEVQIINKGYYTESTRLSTGNVGTLKAKDIQKQPINNPLLALQGRVPGLIITQSSGISGGSINVQIQGRNSITNGNDPFYVIDGMPFNARMLPVPGPVSILSGSGSPFNYLNPSDIESITVLKDADATSIYGSRAANGAILITTKKGKSGKSEVNINLQNGWGRVSRKVEMMRVKEYLEIRREALRNDNLQVSSTDYDINGTWDTTRYTDWQKELLGKTAHLSSIQASVSGGNTQTQFLLGVGYIRETSVFIGDFANIKGSINFNIQHTSLNEKFKINFSSNFLHGNNELPGTDLTASAINLAPNAPRLFKDDGSLNWEQLPNGATTFLNPANSLLLNYRNRTFNLVNTMMLSYRIINGLTIGSDFGYNSIASKEKSKLPLTYFDPNQFGRQRSAYYVDKSNTGISIEPQIRYNKKFDFWAFDFLAGAAYQENKSELVSLNGSGYNTDAEMDNIKAATTVSVSSTLDTRYRYSALFARLNLDYKEKYILNLTARQDGSSRFGSANQFHNFYSAGVAWLFFEEKGITNNIPNLSFGKLRLSYGTTGNDQIGDYGFLNLFSIVTGGINFPYQASTSLQAVGHANPYLQWELTKKFNAGLDIGFFTNRVLLNLNYYINSSSNQLIGYPLPAQTGFISVRRNLPATIRNSGWEMALNTTPITGKFTWKSNLNLTIPRNRLIAYPGLTSSSNAGSFILNRPISIRRVYKYAGVNEQTGMYEFINSKGERTSTVDALTDNTELINIDPTAYGGWQNTLSFAGFELDFLFQFNRQNGAVSVGRFGNLLPGYAVNQPIELMNRWRSPGDKALQQRANSNFTLFSDMYNALTSDAGYMDVSFINLKNVSLSYSLPQSVYKRMSIKGANIFAQAQNVFIWTKYKGLNPEAASFSEASIPPLRMISLGLRINL